MMTSVLYEVEHQTRYVHAGRVSTSRHLGYLTPRMLPWLRFTALTIC